MERYAISPHREEIVFDAHALAMLELDRVACCHGCIFGETNGPRHDAVNVLRLEQYSYDAYEV